MKISYPDKYHEYNVNDPVSRTLKVAREFEAIFTSIMTRAMRRTVFDGGLLEKSIGEKIYTDMLDYEYAKIISRNASFGLSEAIVKQIENGSNENQSLSILKNLMNNRFVTEYGFASQNNKVNDTFPLSRRVYKWNSLIDEASSKYNVDRDLISAVIAQESGGNPFAVSRAGAKGLMQLIDSTAKMMGVKHVFNPRENVLGGTKYLSQLLKKFNEDEKLALASYNAGPEAVKKYNGIPPYPETQNYVRRVLSIRNTIRQESDKKE